MDDLHPDAEDDCDGDGRDGDDAGESWRDSSDEGEHCDGSGYEECAIEFLSVHNFSLLLVLLSPRSGNRTRDLSANS